MTIKSTFEACAIVEGFSIKQPKEEDIFKAWAYLIKTGAAWKLQGWYGRSAAKLIENGYISKGGRVQWKKIMVEEEA